MIAGDILDRGLSPFTPEELEELRARVADGTIRRFGAFVDHRAVGYAANALVVWQVPAERLDEAGAVLAACASVSHCYVRETRTDWPFNLYAMVHARTEENLVEVSQGLSQSVDASLGVPLPYRILKTLREYKKTSASYSRV